MTTAVRKLNSLVVCVFVCEGVSCNFYNTEPRPGFAPDITSNEADLISDLVLLPPL